MKRIISLELDGSFRLQISPRKSRNFKTLEEAEKLRKSIEFRESLKFHKWYNNACSFCGCVKSTVRDGEYFTVLYNGSKTRPNCTR